MDILGPSRWPDAVVQTDETLEAFEIEFAPKGTDRLKRIVSAYQTSDYGRTTFLVKSAALGKRIAPQPVYIPAALRQYHRQREIRVVPWIGLDAEEQRAVAIKSSGQR